jgi:hypothetical protein
MQDLIKVDILTSYRDMTNDFWTFVLSPDTSPNDSSYLNNCIHVSIYMLANHSQWRHGVRIAATDQIAAHKIFFSFFWAWRFTTQSTWTRDDLGVENRIGSQWIVLISNEYISCTTRLQTWQPNSSCAQRARRGSGRWPRTRSWLFPCPWA